MRKALAPLAWSMAVASAPEAAAETTLDLYVDRRTQQIFAQPGPGRDKLGTFMQVDANAAPTATPRAASAAVASAAVTAAPPPVTAAAVPAPVAAGRERKWYDKLSLRGYLQLRYNHGFGANADDLRAPGDRFIGEDQSFGIRRARVVLSGDVSDKVSTYLQFDLASTPGGSGTTHFAQLRDAYADLYLDAAREYRLRVGQSKIPYGWENLQSSQNRISPDRADALNSGLRDERDLGVIAYYTPKLAAQRYQTLVKSGLKGSGDYGVVGLGLYNGQGPNRAERNDQLHTVLHLSYPFQFDSGQYLELGADAYSGRFKVATPSAISVDGVRFTPAETRAPGGYLDQRVAVHAIYYPQPFGLQAEWTVGRGPQLDITEQRIRSQSLRGGYVQAMFKIDGSSYGSLMPYLKWQTYRGASKFDTNAPAMQVDEWEGGVEWQPSSALELLFAYANMRRTDVTTAPYRLVRGDLLRLQLQVNY